MQIDARLAQSTLGSAAAVDKKAANRSRSRDRDAALQAAPERSAPPSRAAGERVRRPRLPLALTEGAVRFPLAAAAQKSPVTVLISGLRGCSMNAW